MNGYTFIWFSIEYIDNERLKDKSFDEFYDGELYFDIFL